MLSVFGPKLRQYFLVITVNLVILGTGLTVSWTSPVLVKLRDEENPVLSRPITEDEGAWVVSIGFITSIFTNVVAGYLVDIIGRKYTIILACIPKVISCLLFVFATEVWMLILGRAVIIAADAMIFVALPMYSSEIASKEIRGSLGTILQVMCSIGVVIMFSMGPFLEYRLLNIIFTCLIILTTIPILFVSDSPYFLYYKGRKEESLKVLTYLRGSEEQAKLEFEEYSANAMKVKVDRLKLFKNRLFLKSLFICNVLSVGTQLGGYNSVSYYLQTVLESTQTTIRDEYSSIIIGFIQLAASVCVAVISDRFGRKTILSITQIITSLGMVGLGVFFFYQESGQITGFLNFLPLLSLVMVVFAYGSGYGSLYWVLSAELFDDTSRGFGMALSLTPNYVFLFLVTRFFPNVTNALGPTATYWVFAVNNFLLCIFIVFCIPETKGKTFTEIQQALSGKKLLEPAESAEREKEMDQKHENA